MNKYMRPISVFKKHGCHFRLKFDSVIGGECHGCRYCYRTALLKSYNGGVPTKKYADYKYFEELFLSAYFPIDMIRGPPEQEIIKYIQQKMPIRFGSMCDPFEPDEKTRKITMIAIDLMNEYKHPYMIFTKNDFVADKKAISKLKHSNVLVHISLSFADSVNDFVIEPKAPSWKQRLDAIQILLKENIPVVIEDCTNYYWNK